MQYIADYPRCEYSIYHVYIYLHIYSSYINKGIYILTAIIFNYFRNSPADDKISRGYRKCQRCFFSFSW